VTRGAAHINNISYNRLVNAHRLLPDAGVLSIAATDLAYGFSGSATPPYFPKICKPKVLHWSRLSDMAW